MAVHDGLPLFVCVGLYVEGVSCRPAEGRRGGLKEGRKKGKERDKEVYIEWKEMEGKTCKGGGYNGRRDGRMLIFTLALQDKIFYCHVFMTS